MATFWLPRDLRKNLIAFDGTTVEEQVAGDQFWQNGLGWSSNSLPGISHYVKPETASNTTFFTGDGVHTPTSLLGPDGLVVLNPTVTGITQTDWQGTLALSSSPRTNFLVCSNTFTNATAYTQPTGPLVQGAADPAGGNLAWTLTAGTATDQIHTIAYAYLNTIGGIYTTSVWLRRRTGTGTIRLYDTTGTGHVVTLTSTWQKFTVSVTAAAYAIADFEINVITSGDAIDIAFAQIEFASSAGGYIPCPGLAQVTETDYTLTGSTLTLGQVPVAGATLAWSGTGTSAVDTGFVAPAGGVTGALPAISGSAAGCLLVSGTTSGFNDTVVSFPLALGDGVTTSFPLISQSGVDASTSLTSLSLTDWQGTRVLSTSPRTNYLAWNGTAGPFGSTDSLTPHVPDPAGGMNAVTITCTISNSTSYVAYPSPGSATYCTSLWMRRRTGTGTVQLSDPVETLHTVTLTTSWQRFSFSAVSATTLWCSIRIATLGDAVDLAFAQCEPGSVATPYIPNSAYASATVTDYSLSGNTVTLSPAPAKGTVLTWSGTASSANAALLPVATGTFTAAAYPFFTGDGLGKPSAVATPYGVALSPSVTSVTLTDWQGTNTLSTSARTNVVQDSQGYTSSSWAASNCTLTTGVSDPMGGSNACTITCSGGAAILKAYAPYTAGGAYAIVGSMWVRRRTGSGLIRIDCQSSSSYITVTSAWQRFSLTAVTVNGGNYSNLDISVVTGGDAIDVAFFQVELGSVPGLYLPSTLAGDSGPITDLTISGSTIKLGQIPAAGATLAWTGTGGYSAAGTFTFSGTVTGTSAGIVSLTGTAAGSFGGAGTTIALRHSYSTAGSISQSGVSVVVGDLIIVYATQTNNGPPPSTPTCTDNASGGSNTYQSFGAGISNSINQTSDIAFYAIAKNTETLAITTNIGSSYYPTTIVHVVSGANQTLSSVLDVFSWSTIYSAGTLISSTSIATTNANDYIFCMFADGYYNGFTVTETGTGFTEEQHLSDYTVGTPFASMDKAVSTTGTYFDTVTLGAGAGNNIPVNVLIAAFKAAGGGGVTGTSSAALAVTGSAAGTRGETGASSSSAAITGSASGTFTSSTASGSSGATLVLAGAAAGEHGVAGGSTGNLLLNGSGTGSQGEAGTGASSLSLTGAAQAEQGAAGTGGPAALILSGQLTGATINFLGSSTDALPALGGSGTGQVVDFTGTSTGALGFTSATTDYPISDYTFATGDGSTSSFPLTCAQGPIVSAVVTGVNRTDWQGSDYALSSSPRTNYAVYSNEIAAGSPLNTWDTFGAGTLTPGVDDPKGGFTACTFTTASAYAQLMESVQLPPALSTTPMIGSMWVRARNVTGFIYMRSSGGSDGWIYPTSAWQRLVSNSETPEGGLYGMSGIWIQNPGDSVDVAFAQLEPGSAPTPYIDNPTSAALTVTDYSVSGTTVVLGETPAVGATLSWTGTATVAGGSANTGLLGEAGSSTSTLGITGAAAGSAVDFTGTSAGVLAVSGQIPGAHGVSGAAADPLSLSGSGTGLHSIAGASTGQLQLSGAAQAEQGIAGTSTAALAISGQLAGAVVDFTGAASGSLALTGDVEAEHGVLGAVPAGGVALTGTASGEFLSTVTGSSTGSLFLTGTAAAAQVIRGNSGSFNSFRLNMAPLNGAPGSFGAIGSSTGSLGLTTAGLDDGSFTAPLISGSSSALLVLSTAGLDSGTATPPLTTGSSTGQLAIVTSGLDSGTTGLAQISGTSGAALALSATGSGAVVDFTGTSADGLVLAGQITSALGVAGASIRSLALSGNALGTLGEAGTSGDLLALTGAASGNIVNFAGTSNASLLLTGLASGLLGETGASAATLSLTGSAAGERGVAGSSADALAITGQLTGSIVDDLGSSIEAFPAITGSANGSSTAATSTGILALAGLAQGALGALGESGTSPGVMVLSGQLTGAQGAAGSVAPSSLQLTGSASGTTGSGNSILTLSLTGTASGSVIDFTGTSTVSLKLSATGSAALGVTGTGSSSVAVLGGIAGAQGVAATSTGALALAGSAAGHAISFIGTGAGSVSLTGAAVGALGETGSSSSSLALAGSGAGTYFLPSVGGSTEALALTGTASGLVVDFAGASAAGLKLAGQVAGSHTLAAVSNLALILTGNSSGAQGVAGSSASALSLAGTGVAELGVAGTAASTLALGGTASAASGSGQSQAQLAMAGAATGSTINYLISSNAALPELGGASGNIIDFVGSSVATLGLSGAGQAAYIASGSTVEGLRVTGTALALQGETGSGAGQLDLTGAARAAQGVGGASARGLVLSGQITCTLTDLASSSEPIVLSGSAAAAHGVAGESTQTLALTGQVEGSVPQDYSCLAMPGLSGGCAGMAFPAAEVDLRWAVRREPQKWLVRRRAVDWQAQRPVDPWVVQPLMVQGEPDVYAYRHRICA